MILCMVMVVMFVGQSTASSKKCYEKCLIDCIKSRIFPISCPFECLKDCSKKTISEGGNEDKHYFCMLGCASTLCTNFSSKYKFVSDDEEKVKSFVESCTDACLRQQLITA
ncbi:hypothetical protein FEM48_Zijuj01G0296600 [Ziziphus jujuba var. spinosa]|uniref:Thionin-like protein 2 n=1 Tax=Ziziphus jujuba var. spinosa TaxID=714518 RepID=A0A978W5T0_ZIZJJ|nr:hypothetical protein FEM48_Zijuj01G0296600 [Ziziphus jujuba var. spinosa]